MEKTVFTKIENVRNMIRRMENAETVEQELHSIFKTLDSLQDKELKNKALCELLKIALELGEMIEKSPVSDLISILEGIDKKKSKQKIVPVKVNVHEYLDTILIETDKRIPYSKLVDILEKAVPNFEENIDDLYSADLNVKKQQIEIAYIDDKRKSIILDLSTWNLSKESLIIYTEGLVDYISK